VTCPPKIQRNEDWTPLPGEMLAATFQIIAGRIPFSEQTPVTLIEEAGAKAVRLSLHKEIEEAGKLGDRLKEYFIREQVNQAVFALERPNVMTTVVAQRIAEWTRAQILARAATWPPDAGNTIEQAAIAMLKRITQQGAHMVSEKELKDAMNYYRPGTGGAYAYLNALKNLVKAKDIKLVGYNRKGFGLYCRFGCGQHKALVADD
jgi:hypothetical protein